MKSEQEIEVMQKKLKKSADAYEKKGDLRSCFTALSKVKALEWVIGGLENEAL